MSGTRRLPSPATLYGAFLLGQSYVRGYDASWDVWIREAKRLPTGLTTPRNIEDTANLLSDVGLARLLPSGRVWLDERVLLAGSVPDNRVLTRMLILLTAQSAPVWVQAAISSKGELLPEIIPSGEMETLQRLGLTLDDSGSVTQVLLSLAQSTDVDFSAIGALGEEATINHEVARLRHGGRADLADQIVRVSLISDRFGFDVASFECDGTPLKLEVKTRSSPVVARFPFFLTRHEYRIAKAAPSSWRLVAVNLVGGQAQVLGYLTFEALSSLIPVEPEGFQWTEAGLSIPASWLKPTP